MKLNHRFLAGLVLTGMLTGLAFHPAWAARVGKLRGGVKDTRARLVMEVDEPLSYKASVSGRQLIVKIPASVEHTQTVRLRDKRVRQAVLEPVNGNNSRLVVTFRSAVPEYKIFLLRKPARLVVDFPRQENTKSTGRRKGSWLGNGLTYKKNHVDMGAGNVTTHVLSIAPESGFRLEFVPGYGHTIQKGTLSMISRRSGAKALINASYFDSDIWVIGNLKIKNKWLGMETTPRTGLVLTKDHKVQIVPKLAYQGTVTRADGRSMEINGLNRLRLDNELIFYNNGYDDTTGTNSKGTEVAVRNGRAIRKSKKGNMRMSWNMTVLSGNGEAAKFLDKIRIGDKVAIRQTLGSSIADKAPSVGTAGPLLVYDGQVRVTSAEEEIASDIASGRAPRTGVGITRDGTVLLVVADGRSRSSAGMTLGEFARYFISLGADRAMNFDGGGSSEMVINGRVMNQPSDGSERPVRVALGVFPK
jgi:exopolysaccharide biosynthesis protein